MANIPRMTSSELKNTLILAIIFALRLLGLFMVLPVIALYANKLAYATPALIGLAAGSYGLTQALFQLPFGILSDKYGRKPIIWLGLFIFLIGSLIASFSHSVWILILGRSIQGAGAIGSPVLAFVADVTREEVRTKAMAVIGISIGFTFVLALLLGPLFDGLIGLSGIFLLTAICSFCAMLLLFGVQGNTFIQSNIQSNIQGKENHSPLRSAISQSWWVLQTYPQLGLLNILVFVLHALLTTTFLILPLKITILLGYDSSQMWRFYLPVLFISLIVVMPVIRYADHPKWQMKLIKMALVSLSISVFTFFYTTCVPLFVGVVTLFFIGFNFLEASLPAWVSRVVPKKSKGFAMGTYSSSQFMGMFAGGILGGYLHQGGGIFGLSIGCLLFVALGWAALKRVEYTQKGNRFVIPESSVQG